MLRNPGFEASAGYAASATDVYRADGTPVQTVQRGEDNPPEHWRIWYVWDYDRYGLAQPESRYAPHTGRVKGGESGWTMFTFYRIHRGGLLQTVEVAPGARHRFTIANHAWSSTDDDPRTSDGAPGPFYGVVADLGVSADHGLRNYKARVGIDPTGGKNPFSDRVVWGEWAAVYNAYHDLPAVEAVAQGNHITVFTEHVFAWPFKHCDAYYEDAMLDAVEAQPQPEPEWAPPRDDYERTYVLMDPDADAAWATAAVSATWGARRWTVGGSADDAGIGPTKRNVIAVNPHRWNGDLFAFFEQHYPGARILGVNAQTPEELADKLRALAAVHSEPSHDPQPAVLIGYHGLGEGRIIEHLGRIKAAGLVPPTVKAYGRSDSIRWLAKVRAVDPAIVTIGRLSEGRGGVNVEGPSLDDPEASAEAVFDSLIDYWREHPYVDYWEVANEQDPPGAEGHVRLARFYVRMMELANEAGIKLALFSYSLGVPEPEEWDAIVAETDVFELATRTGHVLALHEYGRFPQDEPSLLGRFAYLYETHLLPDGLAIPLYITEYDVSESAPGLGITDWSVTDWLAQIQQYDALLRRYGYVKGAHLFTFGSVGSAWDVYDPDKVKTSDGRAFSDVLVDWIVEREPVTPPEDPTPVRPPWDRDITADLPRRYDLARWPDGRWPTRPLERISHVTVHHMGSMVGDIYAHARAYLYKDATGRPAYPYTLWIERDGPVLKCLDLEEANWHDHTADPNYHLSVGLNGALHSYPPTAAQLDALVRVCVWAVRNPQMNVTRERITGHMDWASTACPGWTYAASGSWKAEFLRRLDAVLDGGETPPPATGAVLLGFNDPNNAGAGKWMADKGLRGLLVLPIAVGTHGGALDLSAYETAGLRVIVNLRYGWSTDKGGAGTMPAYGTVEWTKFVNAAVTTIRSARGVWGWELLNEMNNPREWPRGGALTPNTVVETYNAIRRQLEGVRIAPGSLDPYNAEAGDPRDWLRAIYGDIAGAEFVAAHGYVRGPDPALVGSTAVFTDDPLRWQALNYPLCVTRLLQALPSPYQGLPVYVTEFNHLHKGGPLGEHPDNLGWVTDARAGEVVRAAYQAACGAQFAGLAVYRWSGDEWSVRDNAAVLNAVRALVA